MPSIFSRSRTNSTPKNTYNDSTNTLTSPLDEFGRVSSRSSNRNGTSHSTPSKKDKKKSKDQEKRLRAAGNTVEFERTETPVPDGSFLPLSIEPAAEGSTHDYGYLSYERQAVLGLDQVARLVDVVVEELSTRGGLATPFIFSSLALDISPTAVRRLIKAFLGTVTGGGDSEKRWRDEARFAGPHELGMCLRWGLARLIRSVGGEEVRGLVSWEHYNEWRDAESALRFPPAHFSAFISSFVPPLRSIVITTLTFLTRLTAHSASSGHTPPTLSPLFGPLFFGLGSATLAFHQTYIHYLRSANALEHLLLAYIRWQECTDPLGIPTRLQDWIRGYPAMLPALHAPKTAKPQARRGARTVRVLSVRRNVRMYSPDLVRTAAGWAQGTGAWGTSKEWDRIAPATLKLQPRYSEAYKKRMDMPPGLHPEYGPIAPALGSYGASIISQSSSSSVASEMDLLGSGGREGEERFRSLTDLKWGEFESMGFGELAVDDQKKLQFDLTEGARTTRAAKRATLSWTDFSTSGFTRSDVPLNATLQFSTPVSSTISSWPSQSAEITRKLKKAQKALPSFGWDTTPVIGTEEVVEEAFIDVFCDLIYGGGWMDRERSEELDRECNWALIEYKSLPPLRSTASGVNDPRIATTILLYEEFVPLEYRQQLALPTSTRRRLPSLFSSVSPSGSGGKGKGWKQAQTLNGRPYVVGHVPHSPSYREMEFEGLLRGEGGTKVLTLDKDTLKPPGGTSGISSPLYVPAAGLTPVKSKAEGSEDSHATTESPLKRHSRFRLPGGIPVPSPGGARGKAGATPILPAEYSQVEFETRLASYSDDEGRDELGVEAETSKQKRRESRDDAWVDILVGAHARRYGGQEAEMREGRGERRKGAIVHDPELASLEVARVLASVAGERSFSPEGEPVEDGEVAIQLAYDELGDTRSLTVDEIETVPRTSGEPDSLKEGDTMGMDDHVLSARQVAKRERRLGYFDLHPERKLAAGTYNFEDDLRRRLAEDDELYSVDDDDDDDETRYGQPETDIDSSLPPLPPPKNEKVERYSPPEVVHVPDFQEGAHRAPIQAKVVPAIVAPPVPLPVAKTIPKLVTPSKTAALIEMYRERERQPAVVAPIPTPGIIPASRLPVRKDSHVSSLSPGLELSPQPSPLQQSPLTLSAVPSPPSPIPEPPQILADDLGRASPMRYVHGAPLHNVLEEEEEEV